jgi:membrane-associated phospholipid phosphatase
MWKPARRPSNFDASPNFTDRVYFAWFLGASVLLVARSQRIEHAWTLIGVNLLACVVIASLRRLARWSVWWQLVHDWYPLLAFILCFEEVSRLSFLFRDGWQDHYLLAFEARLFAVPPTVWLGQHGSPLFTELFELGYFSYFILLMIVGGTFYFVENWRAFRQVMDATVFSYLLCYLFFLAFPTEGPAHTLASLHNFQIPGGGPFHWIVGQIQRNAGVHGNAFPSVHVAGATVSLFFAWRYAPRLGLALTPLVILLCIGAVYDRYHYVSDVAAGAVFGLVPAWMVMWGWVGTRVADR